MDLATELQKIYDSEINIEIGWFWDGGIDVRLGDKMNGSDSQQIVFAGKDIYTVSLRGGAPQPVGGAASPAGTPSWSHDGRWIYFAGNRTGESQIWKVPAAGGDPVPLTRDGGSTPFESMDRRWVYYIKPRIGELWRVPTGGGEEKKVLPTGRFALARSGIYYWHERRELRELVFADGSTRTVRPFQAQLSGGPWFSVSPDERWLLYTQVDQGGSDLLLVENFR